MKLKSLHLKDFRNHRNLDIELNGDSTIIKGANGAGKTNILEAINLLSTTKSLRTRYDKELIFHESDIAHITGVFNNLDRNNLLELTISKSNTYENSSKKLVKVNKVKKSLNNFVGMFKSVLFTPEDIQIITGAPSLRRSYLDNILIQVSPNYKETHKEYILAVRQRNKVLEGIANTGNGQRQLPFWTQKILEKGKIIQKERQKFFDFINSDIHKVSEKLNNTKTFYEVQYNKNELSEDRLDKYILNEIAAKSTLVGPHRDDFMVKLNGYDIKHFGSRGQQRTLLLSMKICELEYIEKNSSIRPVLLLDDIFSELDPQHKQAILNIVKLQQTIISQADKTSSPLVFETLDEKYDVDLR